MQPVTVLDVANAAPTTAERFLTGLDDDELLELAWDLCRMYGYASRRLLSNLGYMANLATLNEICECDDDWNLRYAAQLVLSHELMVNAPSTSDPDGDRVPTSLRAEGAHQVDERWHILGVVDRKVEAISAIPRLWRWLLPQLSTRAGQDLLQRFALVELVDDD